MTFGELLQLRAEILAASPQDGGSEMASPATLSDEVVRSQDGVETDEVTYLVPIQAGDFDGDGKDDVLALDWSWYLEDEEEEALDLALQQGAADFHNEAGPMRALSGLDGSELWRIELNWYDAFRIADIDGDGDIELLVNRLTTGYDLVYTLEQEIELIDGRTGATAWRRQFDGEATVLGTEGIVYAGAMEIYYAAIVAGVRNLLTTVQPMLDATGDGKGDVFAGTLDMAEGLVYSNILGGPAPSAARFTGIPLSGTSGAPGQSLTAVSLRSLPWAAPAADINGDGLADALLNEQAEVDLLRALGFDGTEYWRTASEPGIPSTPGDLTGDAKPDVLVREIEEWYGYVFEYGLAAHDGSDGTPLWHADTSNHSIVALTDSVDAAGLDVLVAEWTWSEELDVEGLRFEVWNGGTGTDLWSREIFAPDQDSWLLVCGCPADFTGDGRLDALMATERYDENLGWVYEVRALDGASGADVWVATDLTGDELPVPLEADADGDGTGDLIWFEWTYDPDTDVETITARIARGMDRGPLWSVTIVSGGWIWLNSALGADVVGSSSAELVVGVELQDPGTGEFNGPAQAYDANGLVWTTS